MKSEEFKPGRSIVAGDTIEIYSPSKWNPQGKVREVKRIIGESRAGSWQECRGGFPLVEYTTGETDMLVPGTLYRIVEP